MLGDEALGPELCRFLTTFNEPDQQELVARLDALVKNAVKSEAIQHIRSLAGVTWDQALVAYAAWRNYSKDEKARWARAVLLQKAVQPPENEDAGHGPR